MELSNMLIEGLKGQAMEKIASQLGMDSKMVKGIAGKALPMILGGLEKNTETEEGAKALDGALVKHNETIKDGKGINLDDGAKIIGHIFGSGNTQASELAKSTGANEKETSGVLSALGPIVMGALGQQKKAGGLGAQDLMKMLSGTSKDSNILGMVLDQDGDGDFDKQDAMKFGMDFLKKKFFGKK